LEDEASGECQLVAASAPEPLIERCYVGVAFLAYLAASRFADHIPYYREEDILARVGFSIHRATQWRWMHALAGIVLPLVELMRERTMQSWVQGIDETPCDILCPELGRTRSAYLYAQYGDAAHPYVCFAFASHKDEENVRRIVGSYEGYLQSDAYICYELIAAASDKRIIAVGCWAHARRKFEPLIEAGPHPQAAWILGEIQKLYDIEDRAREMTDDHRLALRQAESRPIVTGIKAWLDVRDHDELPKSPLRAGVHYLHSRWEAFERFLEDGRIPIDNNRTEAANKGPVMGKKAWLFFGNERAGETAAVFYTLTMSCKRHNIDVQAYLLDVFRRIRTATPAELESLLPDRWIQNHPEARVAQRVQESHAAAARKRQRRARRRCAVPSG
jgi:transposase